MRDIEKFFIFFAEENIGHENYQSATEEGDFGKD